ncbi:MAG TPA: hypothetical protein VKH17_08735 [Acidimicrobiia bacterium]|nr:hypothetical protein [Acidimicrobiia bacterium]HMF83849.1 hypothetical protein [Acidimicrobiia bacterium]
MRVESRDSVSLKPAELDEFGQLLASVELPMKDDALDDHIERFPLVTSATTDDELYGFLFGSLERIGGTPCILWGMGAIRRGRQARPTLDALVGELYRRAAISFPDEDVLVAGRFAHPSAYALLNQLSDVCPRPKYSPTGEERAWGRRLARRFGCDSRYDDRKFRLKANAASAAVLHAAAVKAGGKAAAEVVGAVRPHKGEAVIAFGWATAEALVDGLAPPKTRR